MYGWFEPGGGINKFFNNTKLIDILLRSSTMSNNIVIGNGQNSNGNAALYISQNSVGVQKIPNPYYAMDVGGFARFNHIDIGDIQYNTSTGITSTNSSLHINNLGLVENRMNIVDNIKTLTNVLRDVQVLDVFQTPGSMNSLTVTLSNDADISQIKTNSFLKIKGSIYEIDDIINKNTLVIHNFLDKSIIANFPFINNEIIEISILDNFNYSKDIIIVCLITIKGPVIITQSSAKMNIAVDSQEQLSYLKKGSLYSLTFSQSLENLLILESISYTSLDQVNITLRTLDNAMFPVTSFGQMKLFLLNALYPERINDLNVVVGVYTTTNTTSNQLWIKGSRLDNVLAQTATIPVTSITLNETLKYDVSNMYKSSDGKILASLPIFTNTSYAFSSKGVLSYQLTGYPFKILEKTKTRDNNWLYRVFDYLSIMSQMSSYLNQFVHVSGYANICTLKRVDFIANTLILDRNINVSIGDFAYIIPFKKTEISSLGNGVCSVQDSLAIGTKFASQRLTVNGNIGLNGKVVFEHEGGVNGFQSFEDNKLNLNDSIVMEKNVSVSINTDTTVFGKITSEGFLQFSDRKIKKHIKVASSKKDLETIKKITIYNFMLKDGSQIQKGVIAQDVQDIVPGIVHETEGFIPSVCKYGRVLSSNTILLRSIEPDVFRDFKKGMQLQIKFDDMIDTIRVIKLKQKKGSVFLKYTGNYFAVGKIIYVVGPWTKCKTVDKDHLFYMLFNAVKAIT